MAGAKLKATIVIDGKQYQNEIQDCIKETKKLKETANDTQKELDEMAKGSNLQQGFQKFGKSVGMSNQSMLKFGKGLGFAAKALGAVGLAIGSAKAAYETYDTIMKSNAITAKEWTSKTGAMRDVTNEFFIALSDGDWSAFEDGIINALKLANKYEQRVKTLKTDLQVNDVLIAKYEAELNDLELDLMSSKLSNDDKSGLYDKIVDTTNKLQEVQQGSLNSLKETLVSKFATFNVTLPEEELNKLLRYMTGSTEEGAALQRLIALEKLQADKKDILVKKKDTLTPKQKNDLKNFQKQITAAINRLVKKFPYLQDMKQIFKRFGDLDKDDSKELLDLINSQIGMHERVTSTKRQKEDMMSHFDENGNYIPEKTGGSGGGNGSGNDSDDTPAVANSIKEATQLLNAELAKEQALKDKIANTDVNSPAMAALQQELKEVQGLITSYKQLKIYRGETAKGNDTNFDGEIKPSLGMNVKLAGKDDANKLVKDKKESGFFKNPMKDVGEDDLSWVDVAQEGVDSLTSSLSSLSGMLGESAAQWLNFVATFASGIASILPLIEKMITANAAESASEAGKQASKIPFGWIAIPAILATVVGMFSALPKFAQGGIVQGSPLGDLNLARVNGGEMMMNTRQQQHLWNVINGGGINNNSTSGKVQFRIAGKELVGVLNNYKNKRETVL